MYKIKFLNGEEMDFSKLRNADLRNADLSGADLSYADLSGADLSGANLSYAKDIYIFKAFDTSDRIVFCVKYKNTWMVKAGCFWGNLEELEKKVKSTHNSKVYLSNIELLKQL